MKFNCGPTAQEKHNAKKEWHLWFAWYPVRLFSNDHECRWLEYVWRRGTYCQWGWDYHWSWEYQEI